jgi:hypothetical protein
MISDMRIQMEKREPGRIEFGIIYGSIAILCVLAAKYLPIAHLAPSCVFRGISGIPCPTCGATRSLLSLTKGNFAGALTMNPLVAILVPPAVVLCAYSIITLLFGMRRMTFIFSEREKDGIRIAAVMIVLLNWGYLLYAH